MRHYFGKVPEDEAEFWLRYGEALWLEERSSKRLAAAFARLFGGRR
ncbi:hypothetical protein GF359_05035 [candidate division WOR-3 bacterium]|uniref:Uncharacterized protein n=1 Tax=candidate division WOR-3 bacterium TaxID=2052148 RepID=A0A9D5QDZ6_UNCW3|nr:hypothetical protein [candidate division WOR-3 bacterium]MBD3364560.1 hypothetical protein [candidate division WOR-3 bacterium]